MIKGVDDWLAEHEGMEPRWQKFIEEYTSEQLNIRRLLDWLDAAYSRGYNDAKREIQ